MLYFVIYILFSVIILTLYCKYVDNMPLLKQVKELYEEEKEDFTLVVSTVIMGILFAIFAIPVHYYKEIKTN